MMDEDTLPVFNEPDYDSSLDPGVEPPVPGTKTGDPAAPYGYTRDGNVRGKPGQRGTARKGTAKASQRPAGPRSASGGSAGGPPPPGKTAPKQAPPPAKKTVVDYRPGLMELGTQGVTTMAIVGLMKQRTDVLQDAAAIDAGLPSAAELLNQAAEQWTFVAAMLDKLLKFGPYAASGGGVLIMLSQLAVNHRMMPPGLVPGTVAPEQLIPNFIEKQMAESKEFRAAMEWMTSPERAQQPASATSANGQAPA
jgi:hypothetical protein